MHRRILVNTEDRLDGNRTHFRFSLDGDGEVFQGKRVRVAVEWCDAIRCSEVSNDYSAISSGNGSALLLECLSFSQTNTWCSWNGSSARALCLLQNWLGSGVYGIQQDNGSVRRDTMGAVSSGLLTPLEFRLSMFVNGTFRPVDPAANIEAYSFGLVFWTPDEVAIPAGISAPFYRAWLSTADRTAGTVQDCYLSFRLPTSQGGKWMAGVDYWSPVKHQTANLSPGLKLSLTGLIKNETYSDSFLHLNRSYRTGETSYYGIRLSIKPMCTSHIGHAVVTNPDAIDGVRVRVLDTVTGEAPADPGQLSEFAFSIVVWPAQ